MFKGTPDGKKLIELSIKQVEQKLAYEQEKATQAKLLVIRRPGTPRPTELDIVEEFKKLKPCVE